MKSRQGKLVTLPHQIYLTLRNEIMRGHYGYAEGGKSMPLPSEDALAEQFGVSRMTLRTALAALERDDLIVRKQGLGTFVVLTSAHLRRTQGIESVYDDVTELIKGYEHHVRAFESMQTPAFVLSHAPDFGPECQYLSILCTREGKPVHLNHQYIPGPLRRDALKRAKRSVSLLLFLRSRGIYAETTEFDISGTAADLSTAALLDVQVGMPLIFTRRLSKGPKGDTIDFFEALTRPDRYSYRFKFSGSAKRRGRSQG